MYAQVIVDIAHENVAKVFTYAIPEDMSPQKGSRVLVPFGPRTIEGVVLGIAAETELEVNKIKPIKQVLDPKPTILPPLLELAEEMAEKAHCPLAETLRLMYPAALRGGRIKVKKEWAAKLSIPLEEVDKAIAQNKRSGKKQTLLALLKNGEEVKVDELKIFVKDPMPSLKDLAEKDIIDLYEVEQLRSPYENMPISKTQAPKLMPQQEEVLEEMVPSLAQGQGKFLLHGITGAGKTEVYMHLVDKALTLGKGAIILVPEIALTPQMIQWFRNRFGERAAVLHSRLSQGEHYDEWRRIRRGAARVVIGARSAVFAPVEKLGLVVVDEEHEQSYYSDKHPRYDAREVAESRCKREGATLLLSSATPSVLSFAKARRGDYVLLEMTQRVMARPLPEVEIVDMRKELEEGNRSIFSHTLQHHLKDCIEKGRQAILFLNRRGHSSFVSCRKCGYVVKCDQCDISMTYHKEGGRELLRCHYCGKETPPPVSCPNCHSNYIRFFGLGTQKVEEEVKSAFPGIGVLRMDIDTVAQKDGHANILRAFSEEKTQVLIGTQMVAKGLDFPNVTLVGVIAADMTLNLPDYRAPERTFQLLTQVAGRAGRSVYPGHVVIQTYKPDHPIILAAAAQDYRSFFEEEFMRRKRSLYPPFTAISRLLIEGTEERQVQEKTVDLFHQIDEYIKQTSGLKQRVMMLRHDTAPIKMLRGKYRYHVLLKTIDHPAVEKLYGYLSDLAQNEGEKNLQVFFELNPSSMV